MKLVTLLALIVMSICGCATSSHVLHWRKPPTFWNMRWLIPHRESSVVGSNRGLALLYDRAERVPIVIDDEDGSAWVHYAILLKNGGKLPRKVDLRSARIESGKLESSRTLYPDSEKVKEIETIESGKIERSRVWFKLPPEMVDRHSDSSAPLDLVVPVLPKGKLRLSLWLWKE